MALGHQTRGSDRDQHIYLLTCVALNQLMYLGSASLHPLMRGIGQKKKKKSVTDHRSREMSLFRVFIHKILSTIQTLNRLLTGHNTLLILILLTYSAREKKEGGGAYVHQLIVGGACWEIDVLDPAASQTRQGVYYLNSWYTVSSLRYFYSI